MPNPKNPILRTAVIGTRGGYLLGETEYAQDAAFGHDMVSQSLVAAAQLAEKGLDVRVIDCHTLKPIDEAKIVQAPMDGAPSSRRQYAEAHR